MMTYTIETTKANLETAYGEKWIVLSEKAIICPALELIFSTNKDGSLHPIDAKKLSQKQDNNENR
jgi:hypothetical protein